MEAIHVADLVPDLFEDLRAGVLAKARAAAVAPVTSIPEGPWPIDTHDFNRAAAPGGALVIAGLLSRSVSVGRRTAMEFLGPGDVLRPWVLLGDTSPLRGQVHWQVHDPVLLAVLDREFIAKVAPWPAVTAALMDRLILRSRWLAYQLAIVAEQGAERRVLLLLWHFAGRWGKPNRAGTSLPIRLTHELLAGAVGASRPTVSTAVARLQRAGRVSRRPGGTWLLHGELPPELRALSKN